MYYFYLSAYSKKVQYMCVQFSKFSKYCHGMLCGKSVACLYGKVLAKSEVSEILNHVINFYVTLAISLTILCFKCNKVTFLFWYLAARYL